jgi:hypothetical protein
VHFGSERSYPQEIQQLVGVHINCFDRLLDIDDGIRLRETRSRLPGLKMPRSRLSRRHAVTGEHRIIDNGRFCSRRSATRVGASPYFADQVR